MKSLFRIKGIYLATAAIVILSLVLAGCSSTPSTSSSDKTQLRTINVTGVGKVYLTPDVAYVTIGVQTQNAEVAKALSDNNQQANAIAQSIKSLGIADKDIQTSSFNIYPQQQYDKTGVQTGIIYVVNNNVYITVRDINSLGRLLDLVVSSGANTIQGISFDVLDKTKALSDARTLAVQDARNQAAELAKAAGVTLGPLASLNVYNSSTPVPVYEGKLGGGAAVSTTNSAPVSAGQLIMEVDAQLAYEIK